MKSFFPYPIKQFSWLQGYLLSLHHCSSGILAFKRKKDLGKELFILHPCVIQISWQNHSFTAVMGFAFSVLYLRILIHVKIFAEQIICFFRDFRRQKIPPLFFESTWSQLKHLFSKCVACTISLAAEWTVTMLCTIGRSVKQEVSYIAAITELKHKPVFKALSLQDKHFLDPCMLLHVEVST